MMISGADAVDWNQDGDLDIITGQGHGGSGLRFYERDYIEDCINDTHPIVIVEGFQQAKASLLDVVRRYADGMIEHGRDFPRHAGFYIHTWAHAYKHTSDETFLKAIDAVLTGYEKKRRCPAQLAGRSSGSPNTGDALSMAIDCDGAARKVPQPLRTRLTMFAAGEDQRFCSLPHDLKHNRGFVKSLAPAGTPTEVSYTSQWDPRQGRQTTAAVGVMCMSRYQNTGHVG